MKKIWVGGYQEGYEPNVLYMYKAEDIYKSKDEIPTNLVDKHLGRQDSLWNRSMG